MKRTILFSLLLISSLCFGQEPTIEWDKSLGGTENDAAFSIQQTLDDGYIIVGDSYSTDVDVTGSHGSGDYWVVKLDSYGDITWQKSLGGIAFDYANSIKQTIDGGYIVAGSSGSNDGDVTGNQGSQDYWVIKLDAVGNIIWQKSLGGSGYDDAYSVQQTTDQGYIIAGRSQSIDGDVTGNNVSGNYWVVKLDTNGDISWQKSMGGSELDYALSIQQTTDEGYIVAGYSLSNDGDVTGNQGNYDSWVVKLDSSGNIVWQKSLGGSGNDRAYSLQQTTDGGYIFAGHSDSIGGDVTSNQGGLDYWIVKLNDFGNITWQKSLGGSGDDRATSIYQTIDGGYIVAGFSDSNDGDITGNHGGVDSWIVKLDSSGMFIWQKSLGGTENDLANSINETSDGGFVFAGYSNSDDGDVTGNIGSTDYWVVKLSPETSSITEYRMLEIIAYPNPTTKTFTISSENTIKSSFKVVSVEGKEVFSGKMNGKEQSINISSLSKGVYSVVFEDSELPVLSVIKE